MRFNAETWFLIIVGGGAMVLAFRWLPEALKAVRPKSDIEKLSELTQERYDLLESMLGFNADGSLK